MSWLEIKIKDKYRYNQIVDMVGDYFLPVVFLIIVYHVTQTLNGMIETRDIMIMQVADNAMWAVAIFVQICICYAMWSIHTELQEFNRRNKK